MPSDTNADTGLHYCLLDQALIRWRGPTKDQGTENTLQRGNLPELMAAMAANCVYDFPALRPHQRHPWHALLTQLAAIALHRAGQTQPWLDAASWRAALLALTPNDADGAAWCLVSPPERPAFLQPPVPGEQPTNWTNMLRAADELDMLVTAKNHDLKSARARQAEADDWLFALVSLQTQARGNSGDYRGISRMNSDAATRIGVGIAQQHSWSKRWLSDTAILLKNREKVAKTYNFSVPGEQPLALVWLKDWDDKSPISFAKLDPYYIEVCRRVRLEMKPHGLIARTDPSKVCRINETERKNLKGITGDPWTPQDINEVKAQTVPKNGFDYKFVTYLLIGDKYKPSLTQDLTDWPATAELELICCGIAGNGNSKTLGYHERRIPISPELEADLISRHERVADEAKRRIDAIAKLKELLEDALKILLFSKYKEKDNLFKNTFKQETSNANGQDNSSATKDKSDKKKNKVKKEDLFSEPFEQGEDVRFFDDLTQAIEVDDAAREAIYSNWLWGLAGRAEAVLQQAFVAGPRNGMQRYKAQSAALSRFCNGLRAVFPALSNYYPKQKQFFEPQGSSHV